MKEQESVCWEQIGGQRTDNEGGTIIVSCQLGEVSPFGVLYTSETRH